MSRAARVYAAEVERATPKPKAFTLISSANVLEQEQKARTRARAASSYDAMRAARPLTPPPMPAQPEVVSAGARALSRDKKLRVYHEVPHLFRGAK